MKKAVSSVLVVFLAFCMLTACGTKDVAETTPPEASPVDVTPIEDVEGLAANAKEEGKLVTVGMPNDYANLGEIWNGYSAKYGVEHFDTDLDSAQQIAIMVSEGENSTADMGAVGFGFGNIAIESGITAPYKPSTWDTIPDWAKDPDGNWVLAYTGTIAFITNLDLVENPPKSWDDLLNGDYSVVVGDVTKAAQAQMSVVAAAYAYGGDENNLQPGIEFFQTLAKQGRLSKTDFKFANFEKGEIEVALVWDFNALTYRDRIDKEKFDVCIPAEGSVAGGDASIININAPHPNAARLAREYMLSDEGQLAFANGYIRPIRYDSLDIPEEISAKMLPEDQYTNVHKIENCGVLQDIAKELPELWQEEVLVYVD